MILPRHPLASPHHTYGGSARILQLGSFVTLHARTYLPPACSPPSPKEKTRRNGLINNVGGLLCTAGSRQYAPAWKKHASSSCAPRPHRAVPRGFEDG